MIRTLLAWLTLLGVLASATALLTRGFGCWTFEDVRRSDARAGRLAATSVAVVDSAGHESVLWAARGDPDAIFIVDFVYTRCITVCQVLGSEFARMQARLALDNPEGRPHLLTLSLDVEHDDPARLAGYARRAGAYPALWSVAAPRTPRASRRLLQQLGVIAVPDGFGGFVHNGAIHVIDGRGIVHGIYDTTQWRAALDAASRLARRHP